MVLMEPRAVPAVIGALEIFWFGLYSWRIPPTCAMQGYSWVIPSNSGFPGLVEVGVDPLGGLLDVLAFFDVEGAERRTE